MINYIEFWLAKILAELLSGFVVIFTCFAFFALVCLVFYVKMLVERRRWKKANQ